jgi:Flp pilus assembly protein TadB
MSTGITLAIALCGALAGLGIALGLAAIMHVADGKAPESRAATRSTGPSRASWLPASLGAASSDATGLRNAWRSSSSIARYTAAAAAALGLAAALALRVPVLAVLVAVAVLLAVDTSGGPSVAQLNTSGTAVAAWCETVRHELEAGQPQRVALLASCDTPPPGLERPLAGLAADLETMPVPAALWGFAVRVQHPAAGTAVAALDLAYRHGAGNLPALMISQVETTRHQVHHLRELHAARAKHRRAMVLLLGLFLVVIAGLFVAWPDFLATYRDMQGQAVLAAIGAAVLIAVRTLIRLGRPHPIPDFFTSRAAPPAGEWSTP